MRVCITNGYANIEYIHISAYIYTHKCVTNATREVWPRPAREHGVRRLIIHPPPPIPMPESTETASHQTRPGQARPESRVKWIRTNVFQYELAHWCVAGVWCWCVTSTRVVASACVVGAVGRRRRAQSTGAHDTCSTRHRNI